MKCCIYSDEVTVLWAACRLGRAVRWTSDRSEAFLADHHGRDHRTQAELALDETGRFLAMRVRTAANMGAYLSQHASAVPTVYSAYVLPRPYRFEAVFAEIHTTFTNTVPVDAYRGAGRSEAVYVTERLVDQVDVVFGDTDRVQHGLGTFLSRSAVVAGPALVTATERVLEKTRTIAAHMLEAATADIEFTDGAFRIAGTDREVTFSDVVLQAYVPHNFPHDELEPGLEEMSFYDLKDFTWPMGIHVAEVAIDATTGHVRLDRYLAVDDVGQAINPMMVEGQIQSGAAQGIGEALWEEVVHDDAETAQC